MGNYNQLDSIPILKQTVNNVDEFYFTDEEKANCLINHFTSVSQLDDSNSHLPQFDLKTNSELSNIEIQQSLIEDISSSLDLNKAVGPDYLTESWKQLNLLFQNLYVIYSTNQYMKVFFPANGKML